MNGFRERLVQEKIELNQKMEKLEVFQQSEAFQDIDSVQQTLLNIQLKAMFTYSQCLLERLAKLS